MLVEARSPLDDITDAGLYGAPLHYAAGKVVCIKEIVLTNNNVNKCRDSRKLCSFFLKLEQIKIVLVKITALLCTMLFWVNLN